jgi:hypothetical protein
MTLNNQSISNFSELANEKLTQPSIFDNDSIKELKGLLQEVVLKLQETLEQERINQEVQEIKKKEGEEV